MRCKYCGGEASNYEPEVREVVDYVPYGDSNVPMVSYEGSDASYLCDDCGRELCDDEVFEGTEPDDLEYYFGIDPVEERKLALYMDIANRMLAGTSEAIGYIQKSVESWQRREERLKCKERQLEALKALDGKQKTQDALLDAVRAEIGGMYGKE